MRVRKHTTVDVVGDQSVLRVAVAYILLTRTSRARREAQAISAAQLLKSARMHVAGHRYALQHSTYTLKVSYFEKYTP
jgi:hypothetical protein